MVIVKLATEVKDPPSESSLLISH